MKGGSWLLFKGRSGILKPIQDIPRLVIAFGQFREDGWG